MYHDDCLAIAKACQTNVRAVIGAGVLVLTSIRQPFHTVPAQIQDVLELGEKSRFLWGSKKAGYMALVSNALDIQKAALDTVQTGDLESLVLYLTQIPNMGLIKASFFAQLLVGDGACLDSHNINRLGLGDRFGRLDKKVSEETQRRKYREYEALWRSHGTSEHFWNVWCEGIADTYPEQFRDAADVSSAHRSALSFAA